MEKPCHRSRDFHALEDTSTPLLDTPTIQIRTSRWSTATRQLLENVRRMVEEHRCIGLPKCGSCKTCVRICAGCCHRLDSETSGVMIVTTTTVPSGHHCSAITILQNHGIEKYYLALVLRVNGHQLSESSRLKACCMSGGRSQRSRRAVTAWLRGTRHSLGKANVEQSELEIGEPGAPPRSTRYNG